MDKEKAKLQLASLEQEVAKLKAIIEAPEHKSLLSKPEQGDRAYYLAASSHYRLSVLSGIANEMAGGDYSGSNIFSDRSEAIDYAAALNTFLALRHCHGTERATHEKQWYFALSNERVLVTAWSGGMASGTDKSTLSKMEKICPMFDTEENLLAAMEKVGHSNIMHMFKTFHGV